MTVTGTLPTLSDEDWFTVEFPPLNMPNSFGGGTPQVELSGDATMVFEVRTSCMASFSCGEGVPRELTSFSFVDDQSVAVDPVGEMPNEYSTRGIAPGPRCSRSGSDAEAVRPPATNTPSRSPDDESGLRTGGNSIRVRISLALRNPSRRRHPRALRPKKSRNRRIWRPRPAARALEWQPWAATVPIVGPHDRTRARVGAPRRAVGVGRVGRRVVRPLDSRKRERSGASANGQRRLHGGDDGGARRRRFALADLRRPDRS